MKKQRKPAFLMANLSSEVSQIFMYLERGEKEIAEFSLNRADKIINELQIEILEDLIHDPFLQHRQFLVQKEELEEYFLPFALRTLSENKII